MKDLIEDARREKVREEGLRGLSGYNGRRNPPLAYAAGIEDNNSNDAPPRADTPALMGGSTRARRHCGRNKEKDFNK